MAQEKPTVIERATQDFYIWLEEVARNGDFEGDLIAAYHSLRGVLHALRDTLVPDEAMDMASQLPTFIRGIYFEGYHLSGRPVKHRHKQDFLDAINAHLTREDSYMLDPEQATRAVFDTLSTHLTEGQVQHARDMLHKEAQELWPEPAANR